MDLMDELEVLDLVQNLGDLGQGGGGAYCGPAGPLGRRRTGIGCGGGVCRHLSKATEELWQKCEKAELGE